MSYVAQALKAMGAELRSTMIFGEGFSETTRHVFVRGQHVAEGKSATEAVDKALDAYLSAKAEELECAHAKATELEQQIEKVRQVRKAWQARSQTQAVRETFDMLERRMAELNRKNARVHFETLCGEDAFTCLTKKA